MTVLLVLVLVLLLLLLAGIQQTRAMEELHVEGTSGDGSSVGKSRPGTGAHISHGLRPIASVISSPFG